MNFKALIAATKLTLVLTCLILAVFALKTSGQQRTTRCTMNGKVYDNCTPLGNGRCEVNGQTFATCETAQPQQSNGCMQNPKFTALFPISPTQSFKDYHEQRYDTPNPDQTSPDSPDCSISSRGPRRFCLRTFTTHHVRMSSIYVTNSMETVRGFWNVSYRMKPHPEDHMGTLLAKGTTMDPTMMRLDDGNLVPNFTEGGTYPVNKNEFDCIKPLTEADITETRNTINSENTSGGYRYFKFENMLFVRRIN